MIRLTIEEYERLLRVDARLSETEARLARLTTALEPFLVHARTERALYERGYYRQSDGRPIDPQGRTPATLRLSEWLALDAALAALPAEGTARD